MLHIERYIYIYIYGFWSCVVLISPQFCGTSQSFQQKEPTKLVSYTVQCGWELYNVYLNVYFNARDAVLRLTIGNVQWTTTYARAHSTDFSFQDSRSSKYKHNINWKGIAWNSSVIFSWRIHKAGFHLLCQDIKIRTTLRGWSRLTLTRFGVISGKALSKCTTASACRNLAIWNFIRILFKCSVW